MADEDPRLAQLQRLSAMRDEYLSLAPVIKKLELATTEATITKVPLGSKCFAFGSIPPSARITVAVGDDFFVECSAGGALGMIDRRLTIINTNITNLGKVLDSEEESSSTTTASSTPLQPKPQTTPQAPHKDSPDTSSDSPLGQVVQRPDGFLDIIEPYEEPSPPPSKSRPAPLAQSQLQSQGEVKSPTRAKSNANSLPTIFSSASTSTDSTPPSSTAQTAAPLTEQQTKPTLSNPTLSTVAPTDSDRDVITMNNLTTPLPPSSESTSAAAASPPPAAETNPSVAPPKKMSKFKMRQLGLL
eukprot:TRINITY_DN1780_c0_g1_i1.p1 TRINITY_DN1780_c0_g1~~TRINITY_DN1780_c0_g1_i1.p1  ORF type:complete len:301 (+),score=74.92 TRINITY_DN1780_c0_g1_i1:182-1084(+)